MAVATGSAPEAPVRRPLAARVAGPLALAGCLAFALALGARPLAHDDLFWHLRCGEWMVRHRAVLHADLFSFTRFGAPWVTHEWGFSLLAYGIFRLAGLAGLRLLAALVTVAVFGAAILRALVATAGRRTSPAGLPRPPLVAGLAGLGLWTVAPEIFLRAALIGELMLALVLLGLTVYRRTGRRGALVAVVALFPPWANLHSGVIFGLLLLGLHAGTALATRLVLKGRLSPIVSRRPAGPYVWTFLAALMASLANANGVEALLFPLRLRQTLFASGIRWELGHFTAQSPLQNPGFLLLAFFLLMALLPSRTARSPVLELLVAGDLLAAGAFFALALWVPRLAFDVVLVALPVTAELLLLRPPPDSSPSRLRALVLPLGIALALCLAGGKAWAAWSPRSITRDLPTGGAHFLATHGIRGRIFNHQNFGGLLGWSLDEPIFWDGRNEVFGPLVREVTTTPFPEIAKRYHVDHLVLAEREYTDLLPELASGRWGLVYWDDDCAIYLLRTAKRFQPLLARLELHRFPPFGGSPGLNDLARDPEASASLRRELDQVITANPENQRAHYFQAALSLYQHDLTRARRELEAASRIGPNTQVESALAYLDEIERVAGTP